jgi:hypothetical protein
MSPSFTYIVVTFTAVFVGLGVTEADVDPALTTGAGAGLWLWLTDAAVGLWLWLTDAAVRPPTSMLVRDPGHAPEANRKVGRAHARRRVEEIGWDAEHDRPDPARFAVEILPMIRGISLNRLARATGLSIQYCGLVRRGIRTPHPRHWRRLSRGASIFGSKVLRRSTPRLAAPRQVIDSLTRSTVTAPPDTGVTHGTLATPLGYRRIQSSCVISIHASRRYLRSATNRVVVGRSRFNDHRRYRIVRLETISCPTRETCDAPCRG